MYDHAPRYYRFMMTIGLNAERSPPLSVFRLSWFIRISPEPACKTEGPSRSLASIVPEPVLNSESAPNLCARISPVDFQSSSPAVRSVSQGL
jgi:hypothetical protein